MGKYITCLKRYELVENGLIPYVPFAQRMVLIPNGVNYDEKEVLREGCGVWA
jgi:hypothetical protein